MFTNSGRVRLTMRAAPEGSSTLSLPRQKTWPVALFVGAFFVAFLIPEISAIRDLLGHKADTVSQVAGLFFSAFWALGWSAGVFILFMATFVLVFFRDEYRAGEGKLAYVSRAGPFRLLVEYELARVRNLRTGSATLKDGFANICFDYDGLTLPFGRPLPKEAVPEGMEFIRKAMSSPGQVAPTPESFTEPARAELPVPRAPPEERPETRPGWLAVIFLIGANVVPMVGVLLFGWDLAQIMLLFWAENAVVGFYALLKLARIQRWGALLVGPFFVGHFGGFMAIHFLFLYEFFVRGMSAKGPEPAAMSALTGLFAPLWAAILAIFISHGVSFFSNFLGRREYAGLTWKQQMAEPYRRVVVLHVTIIFGGIATMALGKPVYALLLLVVLKTAVDLHAHLREHRARA